MFSHLVGNEAAKALLQHRELPSVLLFYGPDGVGKRLFADALAAHLVHKAKQDHPDIHTLVPEGKSGQHPILNIRQMIEEVGMPPFEAPCKVFIIEEADRMQAPSSNALLKTLEEPPSDTYILLTSSDPGRLLPTIVSRCRKVPFFPIPEAEIALFLAKKLGRKPDDCRKVAVMSEGSLAKAFLIAEHPHKAVLDDLFRHQDYPELLRALSKLDDSLDLSEDDERQKSRQIDAVLEEILYWVRERDPLRLEKAISLVTEARVALFHHVKLKTVLEHLFVAIRF